MGMYLGMLYDCMIVYTKGGAGKLGRGVMGSERGHGLHC